MKAILQRVKFAKVEVGGETVGEIGQGFLVLLGVAKEDDKKEAEVLSNKIAGLRVFTDENDKMNLSLDDIGGEVLVISNFTLCADCSHGRRPSFIAAARPEQAEPLYEYFCQRLRDAGVKKVAQGIFGADMAVSLLNDGPVTIDINSKDLKR
ncbi:D-aminoacyl-tRNA deacylase [uncultured Ruminococcus sp.]|jgi:D-tyrosyl-tRNA(Tyr) deacylase|uniref:D-aminoacyl-tRNA deacylase n=1 Tax=Ruminococcus sp. TaxID=41978 RepID=UPI00164B4699|nr:D-aminoacyl-tRNA deacylase [uncultured Ruminococcus sp.]MBQ1921659.1 D-tyrosyl-tRNA(Tyr) deacylase [Ruminococcus sp.]MBQ2279998.1 D-tyrosyl-tRNA(Tyr) deacylase [Ruminococcus sp.]MBQ2443181.1 D-tyrosyl-tRNA(Tyr) deacylase [Ruminococcus sp.]MBQ4213989.1 D-tyrosyl-tRNA(Tyr) deacylase [Ruminococcus sp.]MBQ5763700.1 D-tyrosyl-tRNA(Tyr) deacylase [Ruminococcus sp.]